MGPGAAEIGSAANSYAILAKLASGGMAEIFLARSASVGGVERYVVLKRIMRARAADAQFVRMFLDEARLAAQLQHANIAQVYDIGKLGDAYFFTMEYVHGETVRALLHRSHALRKPVPLGCVLTIAAGTAAGLEYAHGRVGRDGRPLGIVHRDVSPSNLMVSFDGGVKIVDFGVAKAADRMQDTRSGTVKGKIAYLSPEQCRGVSVDRRSDLFSFGIVMWEMLTTERLYRRGSDFDNMTAIVNEAPLAPSVKRPEVPPELDAIVMKLLAKDPDQRFQTAGETLEAIEEAAAKSGSVLSTAGLGRQLRELFGQRPEPWIELESLETHEGVTVTGEPVIGESIDRKASALELELAGVPSLGVPHSFDVSGPIGSGPNQAGANSAMRTLPVATVPLEQSASVPMPTASGSIIAPIDYPRVDRRTARVTEPILVDDPPRKPRRIAIVIAVAIVLGIILGIWSGTRGGGDNAESRIAASDRTDAAVVPVDAAVAAKVSPPIDATVAANASPPPIDATVAAITPPIDAPVATDHAGSDQAAPDDAGVAAAPPDAGTNHRPPPSRPQPPDLAKLFQAARYRDVVDACRATATGDRGLCALAACHLHDLDLARRWGRGLSQLSHASLLSACRKLGADLEPAQAPPSNPVTLPTPPKPDCEANPLACQHP